MEIDDNQNASGHGSAHAGMTTPSAKPSTTAMWLSSMDPVSSQIMESLITSNIGPQALSSSFNLFNFIFQNFENFANELNKNPIDDSFRIKFERPTEPKERPNPNNTFEMIRTMRGHISVGMWALILYCKEGYLSVHLLPSDFIASIIDDKMSDFPAYLEIIQQEGSPANWQIENKPIVLEVIPGVIRHLVEHLVRVSRGEAPANERFSFFTPRKTKETTGVFAMPASVQAAIAGEVLPDTQSSNGGSDSPSASTVTRSQTIKKMMEEALKQASAAPVANQIYYDKPNQATLAQEKTVAVQQFSLPGAPELNFKNPSTSGTNIDAASPPPFLAPPAGLFGGSSNSTGSESNPGIISPPASLLSNSATESNAIATPTAFTAPQQSPFARPMPPPDLPAPTPPPANSANPANPSSSATSLAALLNAAGANNSNSPTDSVQNAPPVIPMAPPAQPAPLTQSGVMQAPPPPSPPGSLPPRPTSPPAVPAGFGAPPAPPFSVPPPPPIPNMSNFQAPGSPPPRPSSSTTAPSAPSPPPMPAMQAPPPPPAPQQAAPNATPASPATAVPVVPFPNFTHTSMPAAAVPESLILQEAANQAQMQPQSPLSLFDDDEEAQESEDSTSQDEIISSESTEAINLFDSGESEEAVEVLESNETNNVFEQEQSGEIIQENYDQIEVEEEQEQQQEQETVQYEQNSEYSESSEEAGYEQYQPEYNYEGEQNYQDYASEGNEQEAGEYEQYDTDESYQMNGEVNGFAASIEDPLDSPEALTQIMQQSQRVVRDGCFHILGELDQVLDSLRAAAQVAMHNDNIQAVTDIMQHSKQIKALRERLVSFKEENIQDEVEE